MPLSPGTAKLAGPSSGGKEVASHWALGCRIPLGGSPHPGQALLLGGGRTPRKGTLAQPPHQLTRSPLPPALPHPFPRGLRGRARSLGGRGRRAHARQPESRSGGAQRPCRWPCTCLASWSQGTGRQGPWVPRRWQALAQHSYLLGGQALPSEQMPAKRRGVGSPRMLAPNWVTAAPTQSPAPLAGSRPSLPALQPAPTSQGWRALAAGG